VGHLRRGSGRQGESKRYLVPGELSFSQVPMGESKKLEKREDLTTGSKREEVRK